MADPIDSTPRSSLAKHRSKKRVRMTREEEEDIINAAMGSLMDSYPEPEQWLADGFTVSMPAMSQAADAAISAGADPSLASALVASARDTVKRSMASKVAFETKEQLTVFLAGDAELLFSIDGLTGQKVRSQFGSADGIEFKDEEGTHIMFLKNQLAGLVFRKKD